MKKATIIGIIVAVAIGIGIAYSISSPVSDNTKDEPFPPTEENTDLTESLVISEEETEVEADPETTGRDLTVELDESVGIKSP